MKYAIEEYLSDCSIRGFSDFTIKDKAKRLKLFLSHCDKDIESISAGDIKRFLEVLSKTNKPITINQTIKVLKVFFKWCVEEDIIDVDPCKRIKLLNPGKTMIKAYSENDINTILNYYNGKGYIKTRNKTMLMTLIETGIRSKEVRNVTLEDVVGDMIRVVGKGKTRFVPISAHLKRQLLRYMRARERYLKGRECNWLFFTHHLNPLASHTLLNVIRNVPIDTRPLIHSFRRTYAQMMLDNTDLYTVSKLLGHESITTTEIYVQSTQDDTILKRGMNSPLTNFGKDGK